MRKIGCSNKAAAMLASFYRDTAGRYGVTFTFITRDGVLISYTLALSGPSLTKEQWLEEIRDAVKHLESNGLIDEPIESVDSFSIFFDSKSELYEIAVSDLKKGLYDELVVVDESICASLTEPESRKIRGICDVVHIANKIPGSRWKFTDEDYAPVDLGEA